jgi:hypothetical protein
VAPITNTKTGRFYKRGDVFTTGKSGITGTISEIVSIRPTLTKLGLQTENGLRWAMVKIGA